MTRRFVLTPLILSLSLSASAATIPSDWKSEDYPQEPARWYGVEVARFPSKPMADMMEKSLLESSWRPIERRKIDGSHAIILGETGDLGFAHYFRKDLNLQDWAEGKVVSLEVPNDGSAPEGIKGGNFFSPFQPSEPLDEELVRRQLRRYFAGTGDPEIQRVLEAFSNESIMRRQGPVVAKMAETLWENRAGGDAALYLASNVASGKWPAPGPEAFRAKVIARDLFYGHTRDWRAAWASAEALQNDPARDQAGRASDELRQAALLVDLLNQDTPHAPSLSYIRQAIRQAYAMIPEQDNTLKARAELFYLQTFAWQGDWERVERTAPYLVKRYPNQPAQKAMARILLAKSLERKRDYDRAVEILASVQGQSIPQSEHLRMGNRLTDPREIAAAEMERFQELKSLDEPLPALAPQTPANEQVSAAEN